MSGMKVSRREFTGLSTAAAALVAAHSTRVGAAVRGAALPALREFGYGEVAIDSAKTGMRILPVWIKSAKEVAEGFKAARKEGAQAVMIQPLLASKEVAELARQYRLPSISTGFAARAYPRAGGLIGYGSDPTEHFRRAAFYVSRILRGAKAGDLPVEQSTIFELVVNVKTAKAIGLTIPKDMLVRAIEVIE